MSAAELRLSFEPDDDYAGQLKAFVRSGEFCGTGSAWFDRAHLKKTFAAALRAYPISAGNPPLLEGGYWSKENAQVLEQCHLRIALRPHDSRGTLLVHVELRTGFWTTADEDRQQCVTARFLTEYGLVEEFASDFDEVLELRLDCARLVGTVAR